MNKTRSIAILGVLGAAMLGVLAPNSAAQSGDTGRVAHAVVKDVNGATLGTVSLFADGGKLALTGRLAGLAPGFHGFHVHSIGICDPRATDPTGAVVPFASAGPHLNPAGTGHGTHAGDLPLLLVTADGITTSATETDRLNAGLLFDADRSAIIIHALPDNYANIPARYSAGGVPGPDAATLGTGDSGGRVACGVFVRG
ncbi:MAG: superoxide dismutase family protein [Labedaea sp.]